MPCKHTLNDVYRLLELDPFWERPNLEGVPFYRRTGKTTKVLVYAIHRSMQYPESKVFVVVDNFIVGRHTLTRLNKLCSKILHSPNNITVVPLESLQKSLIGLRPEDYTCYYDINLLP